MAKLTILLILCAFLCKGQPTNKSDKYTYSLIDSGYVFKKAPFKNCHASTILEIGKDTLLYAFFAGDSEGAKNVAIWGRYRFLGRKNEWGNLVKLAVGKDNKGNAQPCWNPVLFKTKNNQIILDYKVGPSPREWWAERKFWNSKTNQWSEAIKLKDSFLGPIRNKPVQLINGDILYPSSTESLDEKIWTIHMEKSDNEGNTWKKIAIDCGEFGVIQPTILLHENNVLQLLCRSRQNVIVQAWSYDNGESWTALSAINLPNPNSGIDAVSLSPNHHLLVYNPLKAGKNWWNGRSVLNIAKVEDDKIWQDIFTLEKHRKGEFSYPAIIQSSNGTVHISYTYDRVKIKYVDLKVKQ